MTATIFQRKIFEGTHYLGGYKIRRASKRLGDQKGPTDTVAVWQYKVCQDILQPSSMNTVY